MKPLEIDSCWAIIYSIILFFPIIICLILHYKRIIPALLELWKELGSSHYWKSLLKIQIICIFLVGALLMTQAFNGFVPHFTSNTHISRNMSDWGDFATCLTAIFALISIFYSYRAFRSQAISTEKSLAKARDTLDLQSNATMRASFDATFTQIFAQHKVLYDKALQHKIGNSITWVVIYGYIDNINNQKGVFALCRERYINSKKQDIEEFWSDFNTAIGQHVSADFKNYFKYIYHEVSIVMQEESIDNEMKKRYIGIIQSQMNYDELLCYLINQVEYFNYWKNNQEKNREIYKRAETHARNLRDNRFFEELCKSRSVYTDLVRRIIGTDANGRINDNDFIDESWFFHDS